MNSNRKTSIATGVLFILATVAAVGAAALNPTVTGTDHLTEGANHSIRLAGLLYLIAAATSVGIAIALYPLLKKVDAAVALGAVVFRTIEAVFYIFAVVCLLSVLPLGQQRDLLLSLRDHSNLVAVFAFSVGALMYYALFYRSRLVPRWLSVWGLGAALLMLTACLLGLFSNSPITGYSVLILPIALQEMVLAVWLLVKGFSPSPLTR